MGLQSAPIDTETEKANAVMIRIGADLLNEAKDDYESGKSSSRKDILSLLVRANDLPEALRLKDENVVARAYKPILSWYICSIYMQRSLLLLSLVTKQPGIYMHPSDILRVKIHLWHSITMSWALYALSQNKDIQTKLRQELWKVSTDNPTMDDLNGLPYLDAVVRETLRLYPPGPYISRQATKDDCIPLSKPFTDRKGIVHNEIRLVLIHF